MRRHLHSPVPAGPQTTAEGRARLPAIGLPLLFYAAAVSWHAAQIAPGTVRDTEFLALLATVVLVAIGALDRQPWRVTGGATVLATLLVWAAPAGDTRSAALSYLLVAAAATAVWLQHSRAGSLDMTSVGVAAAVALQVLSRPEHLLDPALDASLLFELCLLPTVAALGLARLARRHGPSLWLAAPLAVIERGISPELALTIAIVAAIEILPEDSRGAAAPALAALLIGAVRPTDDLLWVAVAALSAGLLMRPTPRRILLAAVPASPLLAGYLLRGEVGELPLPMLAFLFPAALAAEHRRRREIFLAIALALVAGGVLPPRAASLAAALLVARALPLDGLRGRVQTAWSAGLGLSGILAAGYPWLREKPLVAVASWCSLSIDWTGAGVALLAFWAVAALLGAFRLERRHLATAAALLWLALFALRLPGSAGVVVTEPRTLTVTEPTLELPVGGRASALVIHGFLSNSPGLAPGTPVARLEVDTTAGRLERTLSHGSEIGEWAARRPSLAGLLAAPDHWVVWPAPDGPYFGQRYRLEWRLPKNAVIESARVERDPFVPPEVAFTVIQLRVEP